LDVFLHDLTFQANGLCINALGLEEPKSGEVGLSGSSYRPSQLQG